MLTRKRIHKFISFIFVQIVLGIDNSVFALPQAHFVAVTDSAISSDQPAGDRIDFRQQIYPLLDQHCLKCHNASRADGDLRLDNEPAARLGGHTGSPLFAESADQSEFYRRIVSTEPGYRMPKRGEPLDAEAIELFRRWIEQGASYQDNGLNVTQFEQAEFFSRDLSRPTDQTVPFFSTEFSIESWGHLLLTAINEIAKPRYPFLKWWIYLLGLWGVLASLKVLGAIIFFIRRLRARFAGSKTNRALSDATSAFDPIPHPLGELRRTLRWSRLLGALAVILMTGTIVFQWNWIAELSSSQTSAQQKTRGRVQPQMVISLERNNLTLPTDPMHPPRLGGVYYRGNDERDPSLFNQGFYRTAEMEVWLVDQQNQRLEWNDSVEDRQLSIELIIKRSPGTTAELFSPRVMSTIYLRRFRETKLMSGTELDESVEIPLEILQPDQQWIAKIQLEDISNWQDGKNSGMIYLFYGPQIINDLKGRIHYGIRYQLMIEEGKLSPSSTLWMGSMYDLGGRVLIPQEGEVLLDHWFDFRPIPEIEGENPDIPELLGIPEHEY